MPSAIIDDDAKHLLMLVQSFEIRKEFFAVDFWTELRGDMPDTQSSKDVDFLEFIEDISHARSGPAQVPSLNEMRFEFERCFVQK